LSIKYYPGREDKLSNHENKENGQAIYDTAREEKVSELGILQQSLEEKKKQADEYYDQLLRLKAEFENYRKRTEKEKQIHLMWGKEGILLKQMGLLDVIEQALHSARTSDNIESIQQGLGLIVNEFSRMLNSEGVTEIESRGKKFDPSLHEAVEQVESDEPDGTITDVLQKGYSMNGRVIRPARVKVAKKAAAEEDKKTEKKTQE
jgi:molecular chaperone GrpE